MKIRPLWDNVLVKRVAAESKTSTGLFIPTNAQEQQNIAEVVAVGRGRILDNGTLREPEVRVGQRVVLAQYAGAEIDIDGVKHVFVQGVDIIAAID
jgi:chaperonin GroES